MPARKFLLLISLMAVETAGAQWSVTDSQKFPTSSRAVTRVEMAVENPGTGETARLQLAIFRSNAATVRVFDQPAEPRRTVAEVMQTEGAIAGVNGGYFDPEYGLVGLLVSRGKTIAPLRKARLLSGVMVISADRLQLLRTGEVPAKRNWVEARQCGPFLVDRGRPVARLNDTRKARRTFVAVDGKRGAALGYCTGVSLAALGKILSTVTLVDDQPIQRALNLDGGSSSAFWAAGPGEAFAIPGHKTVRDCLGIVPH